MTTWQEFIIGAFFPLFVASLCAAAYGLGAKCPRFIARYMANRAGRRTWQLAHAQRRRDEVRRELASLATRSGAQRDALVRALCSEMTWLERFML